MLGGSINKLTALAAGAALALGQAVFNIFNATAIAHPDFPAMPGAILSAIGSVIPVLSFRSKPRNSFTVISLSILALFLLFCVFFRFRMTLLFDDEISFSRIYYIWYLCYLAFALSLGNVLSLTILYAPAGPDSSDVAYTVPIAVDQLVDGNEVKPILHFSAPRQGVSKRFKSTEELTAWLESAKTHWSEFAEDARSASLPRFQAHALSVARLVENVADQVYRKAYHLLKTYEQACRDERIAVPGGSLGYIFDRSVDIRYRAFAAATFVNAENLDRSIFDEPNEHPLPASVLAEEFNAVFSAFRLRGGEAQVLYDMTVRVLGRQAETAEMLDSQVKRIDGYLEAAKIKAQLGGAAALWRRKGQGHMLVAAVALAPFILLMLAPLYYWSEIATFGAALWAMDADMKSRLKEWAEFFAKAPVATVALLTAPILLLAWIFRHFSRLYVQSLALAAEASNRAAMADAYARMTAEGGAFPPEHKTIVIQSLFGASLKPKETDGIPANVVEQILQMARKPSP